VNNGYKTRISRHAMYPEGARFLKKTVYVIAFNDFVQECTKSCQS
jgi:hypothetical protein